MIYMGDRSGRRKPELETLEQEVFKALDHQIRRDILRHIGEKKDITFTETMNATGIPDSPTLSYHLKNLAPFIEQQEGRYHLTPIGKDAYNLLLRTAAYSKLALFHKNKCEATLGNAILWGAAIAAAAVLKVDTTMTTIILPILAGVGLTITYELFD